MKRRKKEECTAPLRKVEVSLQSWAEQKKGYEPSTSWPFSTIRREARAAWHDIPVSSQGRGKYPGTRPAPVKSPSDRQTQDDATCTLFRYIAP